MRRIAQNLGTAAESVRPVQRLRITFAKTDFMRFTGHLDLHQTWERTIRRAGLPLAYSQGYNPRPRLQLASALPLGFTSQAEVLDVWLEEEMDEMDCLGRLNKALPPGLHIHQIITADLKAPALQTVVLAAEFTTTLLEPIPELEKRVEALLALESLMRTRRKRDYDLRPLILELDILQPDSDGNQRIFMRLAAREGATGRPEVVAEALGVEAYNLRVERTGIIFSTSDNL